MFNQMMPGLVAFNPEVGSYAWKYPDRLLYKLLERGCRGFKLQANVPSLTQKDFIRRVIGYGVAGSARLIMNDHKWVDLHSSLVTLVSQDIDEYLFDRTTVFVSEDAMPELEYIAKRHTHLLERIVGVAVLTSQRREVIWKFHGKLRDQLLLERVGLAYALGIQEFVCGVPDVALLRKHFPKIRRFYTPGVRMAEDPADDQEVVGTPRDAAQAGALWIVGRPIVNAQNPGAAYERYVTHSYP